MKLTNGDETFTLCEVISDNQGPAHGNDSMGAGYSRCSAHGCEHSFAPEGATVWHDDEFTEELWEEK